MKLKVYNSVNLKVYLIHAEEEMSFFWKVGCFWWILSPNEFIEIPRNCPQNKHDYKEEEKRREGCSWK